MEKNKINEILEIEIDNKSLKKIILYFLAFFIPMIVMLGIFIYLKVYPFGNNSYLPVDSDEQYSNFLQYFRNIFFENSNIFYSLSKTIGGEMYGLFAYYLISPYNLITLLFKKANMILAFDIILILKMATCGLTFMYYLNREKEAKFSNLIFSMMYVFCSYVVTYGFNIMWLDSVILLPLVVAGIDDIVEDKKHILYAISLTLVLITNYYIGFMVCIFSILYFIYKILIGELNSIKEILKKIGVFIFASIVSALIASVILIPIFKGLQNGRAEFSLKNLSFDKNFDITHLVSKLFTNNFNLDEIKNEAMPPLFCGILANILITFYFLNKKIKIKEKILSLIFIAIFIVSFYIKGINLVWSIGNIPAWYKYRYAFMLTFMYISFAARRI